ncbi:hypothetical protein OCU04_004549 [Sclerotinia nivalis]|uniref:G1/S-specific cyclin Pcl5 n=1 Tax=Sclerotinia nivalis TaxID=352851 RepID=A0A9X0DM20_9HELO|nr:hypothetical protein OCU04_004549 [Sclerotinia nivalis]
MNCGEDDSSPYTSFHNGPYSSSIASSASSSTSSVWSDAASQSSDNSSITSASSDSEPPYFCANQLPPPITAINICEKNPITKFWPQQRLPVEIAPEERQNPRRTSVGSSTRTGRPPTLIRQADRKVNFVDSLVDSSALIVEAIWPLSTVACRSEMGKGVLPLRIFIQETLRRSRTSYSTLQVALYYLILIKPFVPKTDFTMEQPDDTQSFRALQCGRRMFLSALILASKYLQDRNYSSRAWSKISGLPTLEINQNEIAFLLAVNWELHITEKVFQRWTDIVLNFTPSSQPPSSGAALSIAEQSVEWKRIVLQLNPELDNIKEITGPSQKEVCGLPLRPFTPLSAYHFPGSNEATSTPKQYSPNIMEPSPSVAYPTSRPAPALGLLPTPRLTPQSTGYNTPAVSAASYMLGKSSMSLAMTQTSFCGPQATEKWATQLTSSPQGYSCNRRSSLANSVSSMSSPESMVSDTSSRSSRSSRSSSISSASSLTSAPVSAKLDVLARCRYAKLCSEKQNRNVVVIVPEICGTYDEVEADASEKAAEAARALQELHSQPRSTDSPNRAGAKRSRTHSLDVSLHENVRELLMAGSVVRDSEYLAGFVKSDGQIAAQIMPAGSSGRKRLCCATEAARGLAQSNIYPVFNRPGMWEGILN